MIGSDNIKNVLFNDSKNEIYSIDKNNSYNVNVTRYYGKLNNNYSYEKAIIKLLTKFSYYKIYHDGLHSISVRNINNEWFNDTGPFDFLKLFNLLTYRRNFLKIFNIVCRERLEENKDNIYFKVGDFTIRIDKIMKK